MSKEPPINPGKAFMDRVFEAIKHGDKEHQEWLRAKCDDLADDLSKVAEEYAREVLYDTLGKR